MSGAKHTPGPWFPMVDTARGAEPGRVHVGHYRDDGTVCHLPKTPSNARLIAAAPELLEACRGALAVVESINRNADREEIVALRAAIAKATGGES